MSRFLQTTDYTALVLDEIKAMLISSGNADSDYKRTLCEDMAIGQLREYIGGSYDVDAILAIPANLSQQNDTRNKFIVMLLLDLTLYHLYSSYAPKKITQHRQDRYEDAIQWLKAVGKGQISTTLPLLGASDNNTFIGDIRINSNTQENYYY